MRDVPTVFTVQATNGYGRQLTYQCGSAGEAWAQMRRAIDEDCSTVFVTDQDGYMLDEYDLAMVLEASRHAPRPELRTYEF